MPDSPYVAIVLAGRSSQRLGGADKAMADVGGSTLLERVVRAASGARDIIVVGPPRPGALAVTWCEEQPVGGGPVAALAAGLAVAPAGEAVLLMASDLPFVEGAVAPLFAALTPDADVALLVDCDGRPNYLASAWSRSPLERHLQSLGDPVGLSMRRLVDGLRTRHVRDTGGWGFDCDTWDALEEARKRGASGDE